MPTYAYWCRIALVRLLVVLALVSALALSLVFSLHITNVAGEVVVGFYAVVFLTYLMLQMVFACLNRHHMSRLVGRNLRDTQTTTTGVQIVGYREDPQLFRLACESLRTLRMVSTDLTHVTCVVDGNQAEDLVMKDTFLSVFPHAVHTHFKDRAPVQAEVEALLQQEREAGRDVRLRVVTQPHAHKRSALYTGFLFNAAYQVDYTLCVDSDTQLDQHALVYLKRVLDTEYDVGAVGGDLRVEDSYNWLTACSQRKYVLAFNLERSAQSYFGTVACIAGPLGLYRTLALTQVRDDWVNQTCCGHECTYGDDRHLTNQVLKHHYKVKYQPYAYAWTESPGNLNRWFLQQMRWNKSGFREFLFTARHVLHRQAWWLTFDQVLQTLYSLAIATAFVLTLVVGNPERLVVFYAVVWAASFLRALFGLALTADPSFLLMAWYGYLYLHALLPAKLLALVLVGKPGWGTSSRQNPTDHWTGYAALALWNLAVVGRAIWVFVIRHDEVEVYLRWLGGTLATCTLLVWTVTQLVKQRQARLDRAPPSGAMLPYLEDPENEDGML